MVRLKAFCRFCCALSVAPIVKLNVPAVLGVPVSIPLEKRLSPAGKEPAKSDQVYGGVPPVAVRGCEYIVPVIPDGSGEVVVIVGGIVVLRLKAFSAIRWPVSVTRIVKLNEPSAVGVPVSPPPDERLNPCGKEDPGASDQVYGGVPPVAVKVCEYAVPTIPDGSVAEVVIDSGGIGPIVRLKAFCAFCWTKLLSVTRIVKLNVPSTVEVPISPPLEKSPIPGGKKPETNDQLYGAVPPVTVKVWE
jgi:hypothetical protein